VRGQLVALAARGVTWPSWAREPTAGLRPAAVLVLFGALDGRPAAHPSPAVPADLDLLLVGRAADLAHHPGQVAFPGGRADPGDGGPVGTALREAAEETGLDPAGVDVLGTLGTLPVPVSRHAVTPVLAWWARQSPVGVVDAAESATVFRAPVADLVDPARRGSVVGSFQGRTYSSPAFEVAGHVVWGFTGLVLDHLLTELTWAEPWDARRLVERP
jgi:8-oxo-dGTP pyrophosphatase MutT (NUDIX family)